MDLNPQLLALQAYYPYTFIFIYMPKVLTFTSDLN